MATAQLLLAKGFAVRALVHRLDGRSERLQKAGAEIAVGSLEELDQVLVAMAGVQRAYFCPPLAPGALRKAALFAVAARESRLEAVVALSQWLVDPAHHALHAREKWLSERLFEQLPGVAVVTVNPGFFADNYFAALAGAAQLGLFAMPLGEGLNAPPSNEDIARVITAALIDPGAHAGRSYRPTGPRLLSPGEIAATFARVLGRPVKYRDVPPRLFLKMARWLRLGDYTLSQLHWFLQDYRRGSFAVGAPTGAVLEVAGSPPEDLETIARRYVSASPLVIRSAGGVLREVWGVVRGLLSRAPDLEKIERRLELPRIAGATLAADSVRWRRAHGAA
jgi:NAD(P)H dehydrogenase (quinone)